MATRGYTPIGVQILRYLAHGGKLLPPRLVFPFSTTEQYEIVVVGERWPIRQKTIQALLDEGLLGSDLKPTPKGLEMVRSHA